MPFDSDEQIILNVSHIRSVLKRYLSGDVTAEQVLDWADFIEMRDDIDYSDPAVNQAIYVLATPELEGELTPASAEAILNGL